MTKKETQDLRCRYFYTIEVDNKVVFKGYMLHEEGWKCLRLKHKDKVTCHFSHKTSQKTDPKFKDFLNNQKFE